MKHTIILLAALAVCASAKSQSQLWATGSAFNDSVVELEKFPDGSFKYAGPLNEGEVLIITTATQGDDTQYLKPSRINSLIVNNGIIYISVDSANGSGWVVPFYEERFRFSVDVSAKTVKGELFQPWNDLYIGGGATENGWSSNGVQRMTQDPDDPMVWTWTGELKDNTDKGYVEPKRFKFVGQLGWAPKNVYSYAQDEDLLTSTRLRTEGDDYKWSITDDGTYSITVNLFKQTFSARKESQSPSQDVTGVSETKVSDVNISLDGNTLKVTAPRIVKVSVSDVEGRIVARLSGSNVSLQLASGQAYIVKAGDNVKKFIVP